MVIRFEYIYFFDLKVKNYDPWDALSQQLLTQSEQISGMHCVSNMQKNAWSPV
jgi:hypothetical protein